MARGGSLNSSYIRTVPAYPELARLAGMPGAISWESLLITRVIPYLNQEWLRHYLLSLTARNIVEVNLDAFSYLFDIGPDRLIAAWGISRGRFPGARDNGRIHGYPVSTRPVYHAGHAIPHRLGGGADINLAAQLGSLNTGAFRQLENRAVKTPGSLYFTYWMYDLSHTTQVASRIQQGLLIHGSQPDIKVFRN